MQVKDIMQETVHVCHQRDSARSAALLMEQADCGVLPVTDELNHPLGVVTDRDLLLAAAKYDRPISEIAVDDAMSHGVFTCRPDDDVGRAESVMCRHQVRRVIVVDERERIAGILSLSDLARHQLAEPTGDPEPDRQVVAATLEAVVQPSSNSRKMDEAGPS